MKKNCLMIFFVLMIAAGCGAADDNGYSKIHDRDGTRLIADNNDTNNDIFQRDDANNNARQLNNNGDRNRKDVVNETRGRTMSDQNPNLLNIDGGRNDQGNDIQKARTVVRQTNEFTPGAIWVNGDMMWVNVYKKGRMSHSQKIDGEAKVHEALTQALPRYRIEVRLREDRS